MNAISNILSIYRHEGGLMYFALGSKRNRRYLWGALGISLILLVLFKLIYPYPNFVVDSYFYVQAAASNADVNAWPIGYSKFLRLIGLFTHSSLAVVFLQYLFLEISLITFFFTLRLFFGLGTRMSNILFIFFFVNPLLLYCSNLIMADTLFNGLSILWITQLLWIIYRPRAYMIITHALLLLITFSVRYNALYYPVIASLAFVLNRQSIVLKLAGILLPLILLVGFITFTCRRMEDYCGIKQFSPFGGWKLANDALYMYAHVQPEKSDTMPVRFIVVDAMARRYFEISRDPGDLMAEQDLHGSFFMFNGKSPLIQYMILNYGWRGTILDFKKWSRLGPLYTDYGAYLIRKYPIQFARWFIWPNLRRFAVPPGEIFNTVTSFHLRDDKMGDEARSWFGLTTLSVRASFINLRLQILAPYPILFCLVHLCFILSLVGFILNNGWTRIEKPHNYCLLVVICLWLCDFAFSVVAAAIVLRYQIFIVVLEFSFSLFFMEYIYRHADRPISEKLLSNQA